MRIQQVKDNKIQYLDLLQFADPKEEALEKELDTMDLFLLKEDGVIKTICVSSPEKPEVRDFEHCNHGRSAWMWLR